MNSFSGFKNSVYQGNYGMGAAIAYYTSLGWGIAIPLTDTGDYDLIVDDGNSLKKVQVKTTSQKRNNTYRVNLRTNGRNNYKSFEGNTSDLLFVATDEGKWYSIPRNIITEIMGFSLNDSKSEYLVKVN